MTNKIRTVYQKLCAVSVFIGVNRLPLVRAFFHYCKQSEQADKLCAYAAFVAETYQGGGDLTALLQKQIFEDENVYVCAVAQGKQVPKPIQQSVIRELDAFALFGALAPVDFAEDLDIPVQEIPAYICREYDFNGAYQDRLFNLNRYGYGIFSSQAMFRLSDEKKIEPIVSADTISLDAFIGYDNERAQVVENTRAFLSGRPAANALLCGDAGTGKSSTVKAVANAFFDQGLRLIELRKDQLSLLPYVMAKISGNPLKFIIFIDDLSFRKSDDDFSMLKAALEGSASAKADNAVIYATSNRRHIIKESFGDREGDDVHRNDTLQETLSLSERFGLVVLFSKPTKPLYLEIVKRLAQKSGIRMDETQLFVQAEAFALRKGNRSARCAEQFINSLL